MAMRFSKNYQSHRIPQAPISLKYFVENLREERFVCTALFLTDKYSDGNAPIIPIVFGQGTHIIDDNTANSLCMAATPESEFLNHVIFKIFCDKDNVLTQGCKWELYQNTESIKNGFEDFTPTSFGTLLQAPSFEHEKEWGNNTYWLMTGLVENPGYGSRGNYYLLLDFPNGTKIPKNTSITVRMEFGTMKGGVL